MDEFSDEDYDATSDTSEAQELFEESAAGREEGEEDGWVQVHITTDTRDADGVNRRYGQLKRALTDEEDVFIGLFLRFFPLQTFVARFQEVASHYRANRTTRHNVPFNRGMFLRFLGLIIRMVTHPLPNMSWHWEWPANLPASMSASADLKKYMSHAIFKQYWKYLLFPGFVQDLPETSDAPQAPPAQEFGGSLYHVAMRLIAAFNEKWRDGWTAGTYLVPDETMIFWTGSGELHMTFLFRKPTPYGMMFKTLCCGDSHIMLVAELAESKERMAEMEYRDLTGASTATTLRLTKYWAGSGRTVVADSWFGSCNTAEFLMDVHGLYSIMCVKNGSSGFPKAAMKAALGGVRHRSVFYQVDVELDTGVKPFYAGGHQDKKPLHLIATCGTSLPGESRTRYRRDMVDGSIVRQQYTLE